MCIRDRVTLNNLAKYADLNLYHALLFTVQWQFCAPFTITVPSRGVPRCPAGFRRITYCVRRGLVGPLIWHRRHASTYTQSRQRQGHQHTSTLNRLQCMCTSCRMRHNIAKSLTTQLCLLKHLHNRLFCLTVLVLPQRANSSFLCRLAIRVDTIDGAFGCLRCAECRHIVSTLRLIDIRCGTSGAGCCWCWLALGMHSLYTCTRVHDN